MCRGSGTVRHPSAKALVPQRGSRVLAMGAVGCSESRARAAGARGVRDARGGKRVSQMSEGSRIVGVREAAAASHRPSPSRRQFFKASCYAQRECMHGLWERSGVSLGGVGCR